MFENDKISSGDYIYADKYNNFISDVAAEFQNTSSITSDDREMLDRLEKNFLNYQNYQSALKAFKRISDGATGKINGFDYIIKVLEKDSSGNTTKILFNTSEQGMWSNTGLNKSVHLQDIIILKKLRAFPEPFASLMGCNTGFGLKPGYFRYFNYWLPHTSSEMPITGYWYWSNCFTGWGPVVADSYLFDTTSNVELKLNYLISRKGDGDWDDYETRPYRDWITYAYVVSLPSTEIPFYEFLV